MFLAKNKKLLKAFKKGERAAMDEVYRHYQPGVQRFIRKGFTFRSQKGNFYFKGIPEPSELHSSVQEVFRRAFEDKARNAYNGINSFTNWVLAIARNMVINGFRNREIAFSNYVSASDSRSHLAVMDDEVTEEFGGVLYGRAALPVDSQYEHGELRGLMDEFMGELDDLERQILLCRFAEGMGQEETAQKVNSTRMKVRTIEAKLRKRLRGYLQGSGYIDHLSKAKK